MEPLGIGVVAASLLNGLRHGFDVDHIAAIGDLVSAQPDRKRSLWLAGMYASGHALVVLTLGLAAMILGLRLPEPVDALMGRFVGATLIVLGAYVVYSIVRYRSDARLVSRWTLLGRMVRRARAAITIEHVHEHAHDGIHSHDHAPEPVRGNVAVAVKTHVHPHRHVVAEVVDPLPARGATGAALVGALHGIGAETPTQLVLFLTAAGVGSVAMGVGVLGAFVAGMLISNAVLAVAAAAGLRAGDRMPRAYVAFALATAVFSVGVGVTYLL